MLVTGGAGFIGSNLTARLLRAGHEVVCLDNFCDYYDPALKRANLQPFLSHPGFTLVEADLRDQSALEETFRRHDCRTVVHLAAQPGVRLSLENPSLYMEINVQGTLNILELMRRRPESYLLFASSSSVYGATDRIPFVEEGECRPISPYGVSKRAGELLCASYHHLYGLPMALFRFFTVYGPGQRPDMAIHKFTRAIDHGETITLFGDGSTRRDYTFVDDITAGLAAALERRCGFEIFNLGNSSPVELRELIAAIERSLGKAARIERLPEQPGDPRVTFASVEKAGRLLGYRPETSIDQGIPRFVEWYREHCV